MVVKNKTKNTLIKIIFRAVLKQNSVRGVFFQFFSVEKKGTKFGLNRVGRDALELRWPGACAFGSNLGVAGLNRSAGAPANHVVK